MQTQTTYVAEAIHYLRNEFGKLDRMSDATYDKLCDILDHADDSAIVAAAHADIKFVSPLARNRMVRRGLA